MPGLSQYTVLLACALMAVIGLIVLIAGCKLHAFPALLLASLFVGLCSGMDLSRIAESLQEGMGAMLGSIGAVVGLGMILGRLLGESGGAEVIAQTLIHALGERRLPWTLMLVGIFIGIPVFFTVGVVLLAPILFTIVRDTKRPLLQLGIPLIAGLSVVHGLVPPHPGPMSAIAITHADPGKVLLYALLIGFPTAALAGPVFGSFVARHLRVGAAREFGAPARGGARPGFFLSALTILLPVALMLLATGADLGLAKGNRLRAFADLMGSPTVAMLAATLFAYFSFGKACGLNREQLLKLTEESLGPAAAILLVVGAGGGFNRVLINSGVGEALASIAKSLPVSPLLLGWIMAALIRVATGSATVAITAAAGIVTPFALSTPGTNLELLVVAMGAGSLVLSHVNDGGFWFVKEYLGLTVTQTLQTWTVLETIVAVVGLLGVLLLARF